MQKAQLRCAGITTITPDYLGQTHKKRFLTARKCNNSVASPIERKGRAHQTSLTFCEKTDRGGGSRSKEEETDAAVCSNKKEKEH